MKPSDNWSQLLPWNLARQLFQRWPELTDTNPSNRGWFFPLIDSYSERVGGL
ncbi:MAG: hypothetical protein LBJ17_02580 [Dysgonamonadaceae bacterium]|nr:hypothetical protein [Dysgonamonadaceae bacterium]